MSGEPGAEQEADPGDEACGGVRGERRVRGQPSGEAEHAGLEQAGGERAAEQREQRHCVEAAGPARAGEGQAVRVHAGNSGLWSGMLARTFTICAGSRSAIAMPSGSSAASASTRPQGSTISEWP